MRRSPGAGSVEGAEASSPPLVSILLCAYRDERTVARSLELFLAQTYRPIEIIMVDSSPHDLVGRIVRARYPQVKYHHSDTRLLPNEAHSIAAGLAEGDLYLFSDPGIYPPPEWVETLVSCWRSSGEASCGSLACYGRRWRDMGFHLAKFDQWLPAGSPRPISVAPTAVLLCPKKLYQEAGGFVRGHWLSDALFSWQLAANGHTIWLVPGACAEHHHWQSFRSFLRERYSRGFEFGGIRAQQGSWGWWRRLWMASISILPVRLAGLILRSARSAWKVTERWMYLSTLPLVALGHGAWLAGELTHYSAQLFSQIPSRGR